MINKVLLEYKWIILIFIIPFLLIAIGDNVISVGELYTFSLSVNDFLKLWIAIFGFFGVAVNIYLHQQRLKNQEQQLEGQQTQIEQQKKSERDARFAKGIELLGNSNSSISYGGAIILIKLVENYGNEYKNIVFDVLCSHIRNVTSEPEYQVKYPEEPSNAIQQVINALFKSKLATNNFKGLKINLNNVFLNGVDLENVDMRSCEMKNSFLKGAILTSTKFRGSNMFNTDFSGCTLQNTDFTGVFLEEAIFNDIEEAVATFRFSCLKNSQFQNAVFNESGDFIGADLQSADFNGANLTSIYFTGSNLKGAKLPKTCIDGTNFGGADIENVDFNNACNEQKVENRLKTDIKADSFKNENININSYPAAEYKGMCTGCDRNFAVFKKLIDKAPKSKDDSNYVILIAKNHPQVLIS